MERLDKIIVCETDKGNYAVRPLNWAGYWDKDGKIKECGLNHIAVFHYKEDAEWYAEIKNAEEQGLLLRLPCKVGSTIYKVYQKPTRCTAHGTFREDYTCCGCEELECDSSYEWDIYECIADVKELICVSDKIGKTVFLTKEEAENALKDMQEV